MLHIDLWGHYKTPCLSRATYFLTILNDRTRVICTRLLHSKTQVSGIISGFLAYVNTQFGRLVKTIRSDNGTEIIQASCHSLFVEKGIVH